MKTTLDLPDDLLIAVKKRAAGQRLSMKKLIVGALQRELHKQPQRPKRTPFEWAGFAAGITVDVSNREELWKNTRREIP